MYHQLCSSVFVTNAVFPTFPFSNNSLRLGIFDFHFFGPSFFSLLPKLCSLSQATVDDGLAVFNATVYVSTTLTSEVELEARANSFLSAFQNQTSSTFRHALQLNRDSTQGNQLLTASFTNAYIYQYNQDVGVGVRIALEIWWINSLIHV